MATVTQADLDLADFVSQFYADPLGFVQACYPWREPGALADYDGPQEWQAEVLREIGAAVRERGFDGVHAVEAIREAVASGHGIGKSAMVAWIVDWIMSTRPHAVGTVTANTFVQLESKTWPQVRKWTALCITASWFIINTGKMYHRDFPASWYCTIQSCKEENSEAFAGQHAATSTSFYIFDEASAIPDKIFEVAEGGLTDGEPMEFAFGNPTRNTGKFYRVSFGNERHRWKHHSIDSRKSAITNKAQIQQWLEDHGEDSDFFRVRVLGLPPKASELQFIGQDRVHAAQRNAASALPDEPLVVGLDVSGGGSAWNVFRYRRGLDARTIPPVRLSGEVGREAVIAKAAQLLSDRSPERQITLMFVDSAFGSPIVERLHTLGHRNVIEVNFGGPSPDAHQSNMRAYMWNQVKDWLPRGAIDPRDEKLEIDITSPGWHLNKSNALVLESKQQMQERGVPSPDDGDALALTFAQQVAPRKPKRDRGSAGGTTTGWMG